MIVPAAIGIVAEEEFADAQAAIGELMGYSATRIGSTRAGVFASVWRWRGSTPGWSSSTSPRSWDGATGRESPPTNARSTRSPRSRRDRAHRRGCAQLSRSADGRRGSEANVEVSGGGPMPLGV